MRRDVPRALAASDVFVLPTLTEALPTVPAEAMAARLPIVAGSLVAYPEMIQMVRTAFWLLEDPETLADACIQLLNSPETRIEMGAAGHRIANQKFSIERQVHQLKELYLDQIHAYRKA